jgi:integrase
MCGRNLPASAQVLSCASRTQLCALCVSPYSLGNVLSQQQLKNLLLFSILKYSLRNHSELARAVVEHVGMLIDQQHLALVIDALEASPKVTDMHFFWNGRDKLGAIVGSWRRRLARLFELAEVPKGHAHRFRDTFAVELLLAGVPIERVSVLLGQQSVRITERHYSPWVRARQEQLEQDLQGRLRTRPCGAHGNEGYTRGTRKKWKV